MEFLRKYWLAILITVLAVIFIVIMYRRKNNTTARISTNENSATTNQRSTAINSNQSVPDQQNQIIYVFANKNSNTISTITAEDVLVGYCSAKKNQDKSPDFYTDLINVLECIFPYYNIASIDCKNIVFNPTSGDPTAQGLANIICCINKFVSKYPMLMNEEGRLFLKLANEIKEKISLLGYDFDSDTCKIIAKISNPNTAINTMNQNQSADFTSRKSNVNSKGRRK